MTDIDNVTLPIDLHRIEEQHLLFYLAGKVPIPVSEFATVCTQPEEDVQSILNERVQRRLIMDSMGVIRLDDAARRPIIQAGKPNIKSARDSLKDGKSSKDDESFEQAAAQFRQAATVFKAVRDRFEAVNHVPETLEKLLVAAKQNHDSAAKEAAKDTVRYQLIKANQLESAGDESTPDQPKNAVKKYQACLDALSKASAQVTQYNESRLRSGSTRLSTDEIQSRVNAVEMKKQDSESECGGSQASTQTEPNEGRKLDAGSSVDELVGNVEGFGRMGAIKLRREGYETVGDLDGVSKTDLADISKIGSTMVDNLSRYIESVNDVSLGGPEEQVTDDMFIEVASNDEINRTLSLDELTTEVDGFSRMAAIKLKREGYETVGDLNGVSQADLTDISKIGSTIADDLLKYIKSSGEESSGEESSGEESSGEESSGEESSGEDTTSESISAIKNSRESKISQHQFFQQIHKVAKQLGFVPSEVEFKSRADINTARFKKQIGDWGRIKTEYMTWARKSGLSPVNERDTGPGSNIGDSRSLSQHQFFERIHEVASELSSVPSESEFESRTNVKTARFKKYIGSWDSIEAEYADWARKSGLSPVNERDVSTGSTNGDSHASQSTTNGINKLHSSAFETSWETIPDNKRLPDQLLIQVVDVTQFQDDKKTHTLKVHDRVDNEFRFDIWKTHDIDVDWAKNEWYAVRETRGGVWETSGGQTRKRLSSTSDLTIVELGVDFDPNSDRAAEQVTSSETTSNDQRIEKRGTSDKPDETNTDPAQGDDSILGEITSEFDDL